MEDSLIEQKLRSIIESELKRLSLNEEDGASDLEIKTSEEIDKFLSSETDKAKNEINAKSKMKGIPTLRPDERAVYDKQIKIENDKLKNLDKLKKDLEAKKKEDEKLKADAKIQATKTNMAQQTMEEQNIAPAQPTQPIKKKTYLVHFDAETPNKFDVKFSDRGFVVDNTRLSFEFLENALSKNINITLNGGTGLVLDAIRMQKIMKYKDKF